MDVITKYNMGFRFILYVTDVYSKYAWFVPLKDKKGITITNALQKKQIKFGQINTMTFTIDQ